MGSSPNINYPAQPSYGEGMAEALKAQAEFLKGTGDFAEVGSLESLLPLEKSIREKTAQTDTDILRQTVLGTQTVTKVVRDPETGRFGIPDGEIVRSSEGENAGRYQAVMDSNGDPIILDTTTGLVVKDSFEKSPAQFAAMFKKLNTASDNEIKQTFSFVNPNTGEPLKEGETVTERQGDGMIDLLGDTRDMTQYETRTATQEDVDAGLAEEVGDNFVQATQSKDQAGFREGEFKGLSTMAEDIQRGNLSRQREADLQDVSRLSGLYQGHHGGL